MTAAVARVASRAVSHGAVGLVLLLAPSLRADEAPGAPSGDEVLAGDGVYGRFDGDLHLALEAGVAASFPGEAVAGRLGALHLHTVEAWGQYEDSLGAGGQPIARAVSFGVALRPLFLPRFSEDLERGPAWLDLLVDSLSLGIGVYGAARPEDRCEHPRARCWLWGLQLATGLELPLLGRADGPFLALRGALRWPEAPAEAGPHDDAAPTGQLGLSLGYRLTLPAHLVDAGDEP